MLAPRDVWDAVRLDAIARSFGLVGRERVCVHLFIRIQFLSFFMFLFSNQTSGWTFLPFLEGMAFLQLTAKKEGTQLYSRLARGREEPTKSCEE